MKNSIVEKLAALLSSRIDSECKVVYLLAECRKLLDTYPPDPKPFALNLYFHWALHINLSYSNTTKPFLDRVDAYVASVKAGNKNIAGENYMHREFILFDTFRKQLREFLGYYVLPTAICDEDSHWHDFIECYSGVIEGGSLTFSGNGLRFIDEVRFKRGRRVGDEMIMPFNLVWEIYKAGKEVLEVDVNALTLKNGELMTSFDIRIR